MSASGSPRAPGILALCALVSGPLFIGAMLTVLIPILPNIASDLWGGSVGKLPTQLLIAVPMLGLVLGGLLSTIVFARWQARTVLIAGMAVFGVSGAVGLVGDATALVLSRLVIGIASACIAAASTSLIGEYVPQERRARVLGLQMAGCSVAAVLAMLASGTIGDTHGWRASFLLFPLLAVLGVGGALLAPRIAAPTASVGMEGGKGLVRQLLALWPVLMFVLLLNTTAFTTNSQASFVLAEQGIASASGRAQMMGINQAMIVLAAIAFPAVRALVGQRLMPALILLVMGGGLVGLGLSQSMLYAGLSLAILGTGNGWLFPYQSSLLLQRASAEARGAGAGLMVSAQFLADALNPLLLGPLILAIGLRPTIAIIGGCAAAAAVLMALAALATRGKEARRQAG